MLGYWPGNETETIEQRLKNLQDALNLRDDGYVIQTLNTHPELLSQPDANQETLYMFAQRNGCSEQMRAFLQKKGSEKAEKNTSSKATPN